jgi:peptidoglycan/LPS O-acetylase OafA/YrhL
VEKKVIMSEKTGRKRLFYLDFIRAIATVIIILTHYNALYLFGAPEQLDKVVLGVRIFNLYIGDFGVALFLIISGASLAYVNKGKLDVKKFYKKRFVKLFPMFWIAYVIVFLYKFYVGELSREIPLSRLIWSALGLDSYLSTLSVSTYVMVGEWFLGLIIIIYLLFPLLKYALDRNPIVLAAATGVAFVISVVLTKGVNIWVFTWLPLFVAGMLLAGNEDKIKPVWCIVSVLVLVANALLKPGFTKYVQILYVGLAAYVVLLYLSKLFEFKCIKNICRTISDYSYACFIIHHVVIYEVTEKFDLHTLGNFEVKMLFLVCCACIMLASYLLKRVHDGIMNVFSNTGE